MSSDMAKQLKAGDQLTCSILNITGQVRTIDGNFVVTDWSDGGCHVINTFVPLTFASIEKT